MKKSLLSLVCCLLVFLTVCPSASYASDYVLPYPSAMPGSIFYKLNLLKEKFMQYWAYGDFGQFSYNLQASDKYLVEANTLFAYNQYVLALDALEKSNSFYTKVKPALVSARIHHKDIQAKSDLLKQAAKAHITVLTHLEKELPSTFVWEEENQKPQILPLHSDIQDAIHLREAL